MRLFQGPRSFFKPLIAFSFSLSSQNYQPVAPGFLSTGTNFCLNYFVINYHARINLCGFFNGKTRFQTVDYPLDFIIKPQLFARCDFAIINRHKFSFWIISLSIISPVSTFADFSATKFVSQAGTIRYLRLMLYQSAHFLFYFIHYQSLPVFQWRNPNLNLLMTLFCFVMNYFFSA